MDISEARRELAVLLNDVEEDACAVQDAYAHVRRRIADIEARDVPVPQEFVMAEKQLAVECCALSQGR
ncbi:MAG: hypothetical protein AAFQ42_10745 [Pseudomonadota bacterium]